MQCISKNGTIHQWNFSSKYQVRNSSNGRQKPTNQAGIVLVYILCWHCFLWASDQQLQGYIDSPKKVVINSEKIIEKNQKDSKRFISIVTFSLNTNFCQSNLLLFFLKIFWNWCATEPEYHVKKNETEVLTSANAFLWSVLLFIYVSTYITIKLCVIRSIKWVNL